MLAVWFGVSRVEDCLAVLAHNGVNFGLDFTIISTQLCPIGYPIKQEADDKHGGIAGILEGLVPSSEGGCRDEIGAAIASSVQLL